MNYYERPTPLQEQAYTEAMQHFAEHLKQFKANCDAIHNIESNLPVTANDAVRAALQSSGHIIQTDDGTHWQYAVDLTKITLRLPSSHADRLGIRGGRMSAVEIRQEMKEV